MLNFIGKVRLMTDFTKLLDDYRLTTAEIIYHLPDYPSVLQSYVWQDYDHIPDFPALQKFLQFWERELEGRLHSVQVANCELIKPSAIFRGYSKLTIH